MDYHTNCHRTHNFDNFPTLGTENSIEKPGDNAGLFAFNTAVPDLTTTKKPRHTAGLGN